MRIFVTVFSSKTCTIYTLWPQVLILSARCIDYEQRTLTMLSTVRLSFRSLHRPAVLDMLIVHVHVRLCVLAWCFFINKVHKIEMCRPMVLLLIRPAVWHTTRHCRPTMSVAIMTTDIVGRQCRDVSYDCRQCRSLFWGIFVGRHSWVTAGHAGCRLPTVSVANMTTDIVGPENSR